MPSVRVHLAAVAAAAVLLLVGLHLLPDAAAYTVGTVAVSLAQVAAGGALCLRASRSSGALRRALWCGAASCATSSFSFLTWLFYDVVRHQPVPVPSVADAAFLVSVALLVPTFLCLPGDALGRRERRRVVLDALVVGCALLVGLSVLVLQPLLSRSSDGWLGIAVLVAYPVSDSLVVVIALFALLRAAGPLRVRLAIAAGGMVSLLAGDLVFTLRTLAGNVAIAREAQCLWALTFPLVALGFLGIRPADEVRGAAPSVLLSLLPNGLALAALTLALTVQPTVLTLVPALGALALVLVRHSEVQLSETALRSSLENEVQRQTARLHDLAYRDPLTGLPNRAAFVDALERAVLAAAANRGGAAVVFLDLDDFKAVNDSLGHAAGDRVLSAVGGWLGGLRGATVSRFGGDEFAVLLHDGATEALAVPVAQHVCDGLRAEVGLTVSAGIALVSGNETASELLRRADLAMYEAKADAKGRCAVYDEPMHEALLARLTLERDLALGLERGEFSLHYQPILDTVTRELVSVEALARWQHPERGPVSPLEFIPAAERTGMVVALGEQLLREACRQTRAWQREHGSPSCVTVNVSPVQFAADLVGVVRRALIDAELPASSLVLEITEGVLLDDAPAVDACLAGLTALGVAVAIDDFGTGYSSLARLGSYPVDLVKLDRSFLADVHRSPAAATLVGSVIDMCHALSLRVVAEGVETEADDAFLTSRGCDALQGYLFSRPLPAPELGRLLAAQPRRPAPPVLPAPRVSVHKRDALT